MSSDVSLALAFAKARLFLMFLSEHSLDCPYWPFLCPCRVYRHESATALTCTSQNSSTHPAQVQHKRTICNESYFVAVEVATC